MKEILTAVEQAIKGLEKEPQTPYRDVAIGGLRTCLENAKQHLAVVAKDTLQKKVQG